LSGQLQNNLVDSKRASRPYQPAGLFYCHHEKKSQNNAFLRLHEITKLQEVAYERPFPLLRSPFNTK